MHVLDERERMRVKRGKDPTFSCLQWTEPLSLSVAPFVTWRRVRLALLSFTLPSVCACFASTHLPGLSSSLLRRGSPANSRT